MVALSSLSFLPADYSLHQAVTPLKKVADMLEIVSDFCNVVIFWALQKIEPQKFKKVQGMTRRGQWDIVNVSLSKLMLHPV